jgi:hypothetical protein
LVELYVESGLNLLASTDTDENGTYGFGGLDPNGVYEVRVDTTTLPAAGAGLTNTVDPDAGADSTAVRDLGATGPVDPDADFGYQFETNPNLIGGTIWTDTDASGTLDTDEGGNGIAGVTVVLYDDVNGSSTLDGSDLVVASTITDADGNYSFPNLADGSYLVQVTDEAGKLGGYWKSTGPNPGADDNSQSVPYPVTVGSGQSDTTGDFGYYANTAALGNRVWNDANENGIQDSGEVGLADVEVTLTITYPNGDATTFVTLSADGNGNLPLGAYAFTNLLADEDFNGTGTPGVDTPAYLITVETPAGSVASPIEEGSDPLVDSNDPAGTDASVLQNQDDVAPDPNPADEPLNAGYDFGFYSGSSARACDVDGDDDIDRTDIRGQLLLRNQSVTPGSPADPDGDGIVTYRDVTICIPRIGT